MAITITETLGVNNDTTPTPSASEWVQATIVAIRQEAPTVKTFRFSLPRPVAHLPGQHYEIRLTAPDGYQAARLYSAASPADGGNELELTIALLPNGEVSPYMHHVAQVGDKIELRGPLGRFFVWDPAQNRPALLIAGGSGVVPMRCMLRAHRMQASSAPIRLLYSARTEEDIIYKEEITHTDSATITLTRQSSPTWHGAVGRISADMIREALAESPEDVTCYVCGATPFVEAMADELVLIGVEPERIKTERYGAAQAK